MNLWYHHGAHVTWVQFADQIENETQNLYLKFYMHYWLQLCQICWGDIRFEFMTSSWCPRDLSTIYRPDRKWDPNFAYQALYGVLTTNFVRYVRMTKELHPWHHGGHVTWHNLQIREKISSRFGISSFTFTFDLKIFKVMIINEIVNSCWE